MKRFFLSLIFFSLFFQAKAQESIVVNGEKYALANFKKDFAKNIEVEGYDKALKNYTEYLLMLQRGKKLQVDTTHYYQNLLNQKKEEIQRIFLDKIVQNYLKKNEIPVEHELAPSEKIKILTAFVIEEKEKEIQTDSAALKQVIEAAGENFLIDENPLKFNENQWIYKTATGSFTQQDLVKHLNFAQQKIEENLKLSELINSGLNSLRNQFLINDYQEHFEFYQPKFKEEVDMLKKTIIINYLLENEVYQKYSGDELNQKLQIFLNKNKATYTWPVRYEVEIYRYYQPELKDKILKALKNNWNSDKIQKKWNTAGSDVALVVNQGKFPIYHEVLGKNFKPSEKIQEGTFRNTPTWIRLIKQWPPAPMTVNEAGNVLKEDFYNHLLNEFYSNLWENAEIKIFDE